MSELRWHTSVTLTPNRAASDLFTEFSGVSKVNPCKGQFCETGGGGGYAGIPNINRRLGKDTVIPSNWKSFDELAPQSSLFREQSCKPGHCQTNAVRNAKENPGLRVAVGVTIDREQLEGHGRIYPNVHVWNVDSAGRVVDSTYGRELASEYLYLGEVITDVKLSRSPTALDRWVWSSIGLGAGRKKK